MNIVNYPPPKGSGFLPMATKGFLDEVNVDGRTITLISHERNEENGREN